MKRIKLAAAAATIMLAISSSAFAGNIGAAPRTNETTISGNIGALNGNIGATLKGNIGALVATIVGGTIVP